MAKDVDTSLSELGSNLLWTSLVDLPMVALRRALRRSERDALPRIMWREYDTLFRFSSESIDRLCRSAAFGRALSGGIESFLLVHRLGNALVGAVLAAARRAADLPTAAAVAALHDDVRALASRLELLDDSINAMSHSTRLRHAVHQLDHFADS
jgi:hypothetical protein